MRTFKIVVIMIILLAGVFLALFLIKKQFPSPEPETIDYHEGEEATSEEDLYKKQLKQYEGMVKILGVSLYEEGTHRLEKDDRLVTLLESSKVNLADFEGKEVKARGFVRDSAKGGQRIMDVLFIEAIAEPGVKLFSEVGYEFSFSYPAQWDLRKEQDKVTFFKKSDPGLTPLVIVYQFLNVTDSLEIWLKDRDQNLFYEETKVKVGEFTGIRRTIKNGDERIMKTYVKGGKNVYELRLIAEDEVTRNTYLSIVDFFKTSFVQEEPVEKDTAEAPEPKPLPESPAETSAPESSPSFESSLSPLAAVEMTRILEKGFLRFVGKTIQFDYPKVWYFSNVGGNTYGMTDQKTYRANNDDVTLETSYIIIKSADTKEICATRQEKEGYLVCAKSEGLEKIVEKIAESIAK